jgi:hypothetical protein
MRERPDAALTVVHAPQSAPGGVVDHDGESGVARANADRVKVPDGLFRARRRMGASADHCLARGNLETGK